jgi:manganese/zinc/iron transport system substrate-binding protein
MPRLVFFILLFLAFLGGCGGGNGTDDARRDILKITATTGQVAELARHIGGNLVEVTALMGPGIDPHQYKASARDVERLRGADLILFNGLHLEAKMGDVLEQMSKQQATLAVAETLDPARLIVAEDYENAHDPHAWFDVELWAETIPPVVQALSDLAPAHAAEFQQRGDEFARELADLHRYAREQLARVPEQQRVMITAHDAFRYLGRAYGLQVRGLQGISTSTEAGTRDVQDLAAFIADNRIPAIFVETSVSPRAVNAVKEAVKARGFNVEIGGEVYSDALGDAETPAGTYLGMVRHNVDVIAAALQGKDTGKHE